MLRALILGVSAAIAIAVCSCGDDSNRKLADAKPIDAPVDAPMNMGSGSGSGSGSDLMSQAEHPHDRQLEILVASLSLGVMVGPLLSLRRRRDRA